MRILRRIELLEATLLPAEQGPSHVINFQFVDAERKVVDSLLVKFPPIPLARNRRGRAALRSWPARRLS